jgi:PTS system glucitol/sorbitol-specific IIA component
MISAKIISIGSDAISEEDALAILFDETATPDLKKVAIIQAIADQQNQKFDLKKGGKIKIGEIEYQIEFIGSLVNTNLQMIGHTTLAFKDVPEKPLESAIYLTPNQFPEFKVGEEILYM